MKLFIVLLAFGLVSCDSDITSVAEDDVSCAKDGTSPFVNPLLGPSLTTPANSMVNDVEALSNLCAQDFPPAVSAPSADIQQPSLAFTSSDLPDSYLSGKLTYSSFPALCARHHIVRSLRPVIEQQVRKMPVVKNYIRNRPVTVTNNVPVITKKVVNRMENKVRHVPVVKKYIRNVIDKATDLVPVVKKRVVPVLQKYTQHVPVRKCYNRPVVDEDQTYVPMVYARYVPVVKESTELVPVTEKRYRPVVESSVVQVPVKQKIIRNVVERKVQKCWEPCECCNSPCYSPYSPESLPTSYTSPTKIYPSEDYLPTSYISPSNLYSSQNFLPASYTSPPKIYGSENFNSCPLSSSATPTLLRKDSLLPSDCSCLY